MYTWNIIQLCIEQVVWYLEQITKFTHNDWDRQRKTSEIECTRWPISSHWYQCDRLCAFFGCVWVFFIERVFISIYVGCLAETKTIKAKKNYLNTKKTLNIKITFFSLVVVVVSVVVESSPLWLSPICFISNAVNLFFCVCAIQLTWLNIES